MWLKCVLLQTDNHLQQLITVLTVLLVDVAVGFDLTYWPFNQITNKQSFCSVYTFGQNKSISNCSQHLSHVKCAPWRAAAVNIWNDNHPSFSVVIHVMLFIPMCRMIDSWPLWGHLWQKFRGLEQSSEMMAEPQKIRTNWKFSHEGIVEVTGSCFFKWPSIDVWNDISSHRN